jgi:hypothetical protein
MTTGSTAVSSTPTQAVTGLMPPQLGEAIIREEWPTIIGSSVPGVGAIGRLAVLLSDTVILRPIAWLMMLPLFIKRVIPILGKKYRLTNKRLLIMPFGLKKPRREIALSDIDTVVLDINSYSTYFRCANLDVMSKGQVAMRLRGVRDPESFRLAILNACCAWAPRKPKGVMPAEKEAAVQGAR